QSVYQSLPASATSAQTTDTKRVGLHEVTLKVGGMTCSGCAYGIEYALKQKPGVVEAKIMYPEGMGVVTYDPVKITSKEIAQTIRELGYSAEMLQNRTG
ncbi:MAG: heavy-metal-associated domain-containing protein, partial [Nitrososphaerales archaeon]